jgi:hypothetical protein
MKIWLFIKFIVACILGCMLTRAFTDLFGMDHVFFSLVRFVINWIWLSYCWNFYYPRKIDNDVNFKDLK